MQSWFSTPTVVVALAAALLSAFITASVTRAPEEEAAAEVARTVDGRPDFSGVWQALNEAHWDLEAHAARPGMVTQQGVYPFAYTEVPAAPVLALARPAAFPAPWESCRATAEFRTPRKRPPARRKTRPTGSTGTRS